MNLIYSTLIILSILFFTVKYPVLILLLITALYIGCWSEHNDSCDHHPILYEKEHDEVYYPKQYQQKVEVEISHITKVIKDYFNLEREDEVRLNNFIVRVKTDDLIELLYAVFMDYNFNDVNKSLEIGNFVIWKTTSNEEVKNIYEKIIEISRNRLYGDNIRSNAVDILIRSNNKYYIDISKQVLAELRRDETRYNNYTTINDVRHRINELQQQRLDEDDTNIDLQRALEIQIGRLQAQELTLKHNNTTVYTDTQNVHNSNINDSVILSAINLVGSDQEQPVGGKDIESEFPRFYPDFELNKVKIQDSLNNIRTNPALFKSNMKLNDVYEKVVAYILKSKYKNELVKRLGEELVDMNGLCATGYLSRLVNVIQGFPDISDELRINVNPKDEIYASIQTYLNNVIQNEPDGEELLEAMIEKNYTKKFIDLIISKMEIKYQSLVKEYVKSNVIDKELLDLNIRDSLNNYFKEEKIANDVTKRLF